MQRRTFLHTLSAAPLAWSLPWLKSLIGSAPMGVVVHSYGKRFRSDNTSENHPPFRDAMDLLRHCHTLGAGGVQVGLRGWTEAFAGQVRDLREELGMYLEGSIRLPETEAGIPAFEEQLRRAKEAGATVVRTVCLGGRRYETFTTLQEFKEFKTRSLRSLEWAEPIVRKHRIRLAVENHKDWRVPELTAIMRHLSSEWIGVTLDFGNSISLLEDPLTTARGLAPYVYSTHVKDMGVREYDDGFLLSEVPLGQGLCDLPRIVALCKEHNPGIRFNLEMITRDPLQVPCLTERYWATFEGLSGAALAGTLQLVRRHAYPEALPTVSQLDVEGQLAAEEANVQACLAYSKKRLGLP